MTHGKYGPTVHHLTNLGVQKRIFKVKDICDTHLQVRGQVVQTVVVYEFYGRVFSVKQPAF
jgi:hypothetical protein